MSFIVLFRFILDPDTYVYISSAYNWRKAILINTFLYHSLISSLHSIIGLRCPNAYCMKWLFRIDQKF